MTYYCMISTCGNIGYNPVFDEKCISISCNIIKSIDELQICLNNYKYIPDEEYDYDNNADRRDTEYDDNLNNNLLDECEDEYNNLNFTYYVQSDMTKEEYIKCIITNITQDTHNVNKLFSFTKLSLNIGCCQLYIYVTSDKKKIIHDTKYDYVLFTKNEKKALFSM